MNLLGYCEEEHPFTRAMVFEYAPNGTLFEHLHSMCIVNLLPINLSISSVTNLLYSIRMIENKIIMCQRLTLPS